MSSFASRSGARDEGKRRSARQQVPLGIASVSARLTVTEQGELQELRGSVWDLSSEGVCLMVRGNHVLTLPSPGRLLVRDSFTFEAAELEVELRWLRADAMGAFIGAAFADPGLLTDSFLSSYMRQSWTDSLI